VENTQGELSLKIPTLNTLLQKDTLFRMNTDLNFKRETTAVHLLPCSIDHDGPARVSDFFHPRQVETATSSASSNSTLEATLRGRLLRGKQMALPLGVRGVVLQQSTPPRSRVLEHQNYASEQSTFDHIVYWNHDSAPSNGDYIPQAMKVFDVARAVHAPIPVE
jgi:ribonuclease H2 subunit C